MAAHGSPCSRIRRQTGAERTLQPVVVAFPDFQHRVGHMRTFIPLALLVCVGSPLAAQPSSGRIEGQIIDSVRSGPLADALVSAALVSEARDTTYFARTDNRGRFRFEPLEAGRYALRFSSAMLDSLQYGGSAPTVDVAPDKVTRVELAVPSGATLR